MATTLGRIPMGQRPAGDGSGHQSNLGESAGQAVDKIPLVGSIFGPMLGVGAYGATGTGQTDRAFDQTEALAREAGARYAEQSPTAAPTMTGATLDRSLSDQSRGLATSGLGAMQMGLGTQMAGSTIQQMGLGTQNEGVGVQRGALGALDMGLGAQAEGLGVQRTGLGAQQTGFGTIGDAAGAYRGVLAGTTPSVAALTAQKLQGQNVASMFGGAASARGVDRASALRAAINGSGAVNAQGVADAAINQAREQEAARQGLLAAGGAQVGAGSSMTGTGSAMGGIGTSMGGVGQGIAGVGQGITASGQGISQTGAGLATTGTGMTNTGTSIGNLGLGIRGQDITQANDQATLDQNTGTNNLTSQLTTNGQDITRENNLGTMALGSAKAMSDTGKTAIEQQRTSKADQRDANGGLLKTVGELLW